MDGAIYDADYFLRGRETGKSLYSNYRWLENLTIPMVCRIVGYLRVNHDDSILDFGCARGYVVKAFREIGYNAHGVDISEWAIRNADEETKPYLNWIANGPPLHKREFDWVIAKDVLEHIHAVGDTITQLMNTARRGVFAVVPLSNIDGQTYVVDDYEKDITHIHRLTLGTWARMFMRPGWSVEARYRIKGIKDNYHKEGWEQANGFITARRVE